MGVPIQEKTCSIFLFSENRMVLTYIYMSDILYLSTNSSARLFQQQHYNILRKYELPVTWTLAQFTCHIKLICYGLETKDKTTQLE